MISSAMQDYLKIIYELQEVGEAPTTSAIAQRLAIAPGSVTNMVKRLAKQQLVDHEPYYGVKLTTEGEEAAAEIVRHHRLIERFLAEILSVPWDRVHEEAHELEHATSSYLAERMAELLGNPTTDPHGRAIPERGSQLLPKKRDKLSEVTRGKTVIVDSVDDENAEMLRYLGQLGLYPDTPITVVAHEPFGGPIRLSVAGVELTVGLEAAQHVWVRDQTNSK